jgi:hypothetical protein
VAVLKRVSMIANVRDPNAQADRMWEKLFELALFVRSGKHRKPAEILKRFIKSADTPEPKLSKHERAKLTEVFSFLREAYKNSTLGETRLATDQTHFYTMATALLESDLLAATDHAVLTHKLARFGNILDGKEPVPRNKALRAEIKSYLEAAAKQTTDTSKRQSRGANFIQAIRLLAEEGSE